MVEWGCVLRGIYEKDKKIYSCLLRHLPYYQNERNRHVLEGGLQVPGEVTPVSHLPLPFPWTVFVSEYWKFADYDVVVGFVELVGEIERIVHHVQFQI